MTAIWFTQALASQRDVALLSRKALDGRARVLCSHSSAREEIAAAADEFFREPREPISGADYAAWCLEQALARGVSCILAMRRREDLVEHRQLFSSAGIRLAAGAMARTSLQLAERKDVFTREMESRGIPTASTIPAETAEELAAAISKIESQGHAVCVKPAVGVFGRGFWRLDRSADFFSCYAHPEAPVHPDALVDAFSRSRVSRRLLVMQYLPGAEHSVDLACLEGTVIAAASRHKEKSRQLVETAGVPIDIASAVARALELDGLVNVQTRTAADGSHRLLEVNTRPSGGVGFSAAAGIDIPGACALALLGHPMLRRMLDAPVAIRMIEQAVPLPDSTGRLALDAAA
jgi:biotin carboxylase